MTAAIHDVYSRPDRGRAMGREGRWRVEQEFSLAKYQASVLDCIDQAFELAQAIGGIDWRRRR
jgi:hypothetical protein